MEENSHRMGRKTGETISWHTPSLIGSNACCLYCGVLFSSPNPPESDKEHLIARNFVPSGTMGGDAFNFIFRACRPCNAEKAIAERHVSSVTLFNSPGRLEDNNVNEIAIRKGGGDFHPKKKGVLIKDSHEQFSISSSFGSALIKIGMIGPPQLDATYVYKLAFKHIQGFFSLICSKDYLDPKKILLLPQKQFIALKPFSEDDWGNPRAVAITERVRYWDCLANIVSAQGYFKAILRRSENEWFWALEWNKYLRIFGGISGNRINVFDNLPDEGWFPSNSGRMRKNVPINLENDFLFNGIVMD